MEQTEIPEEKFENLELGKDTPQITAKPVVIEDLEFEVVQQFKTHKLKLMCRHPDIPDRLIEISGLMYLGKDKKIVESGLWLKRDNENKVLFQSAVGALLGFLGKTRLSELKGEQVNTATNEKGYLVVKAY